MSIKNYLVENSKLGQKLFQGETRPLSKSKNSVEVIPKSEFSTTRFTPSNLTLLPHQIIAIEWLLKNFFLQRSMYYAADAGLGKTIVAAVISNALSEYRIYYVCPPFLEANTEAEFLKWCFKFNLFILPSSLLAPKVGCKPSKVLEAFHWDLNENEKRILIVDEAHDFKNEKAARTKALFEIAKNFEHIIFMSGTPMPNSRPKELWPILSTFAPKTFGTNFFKFALRFCNAHKDEDTGYWNFDGFSKMGEFKARLFKSFMLRQKKSLLNLPPKIEGILTVGEGVPAELGAFEKTIYQLVGDTDLTEAHLKTLHGLQDDESFHVATYRKLLGEHKLKFTLPIIERMLEETSDNILIFAWHKGVIRELESALSKYKPLVITGDVPKEKRTAIVKEFQENKSRRIFLGNIKACGVGFTLTKANRVLFIEQSWRDGDNSQASDRAHRIGQNETVTVQYVALKNSFDSRMLALNLSKRKKSI